MPFVTSVDNKRIYYEVVGEGEYPIILIPGWVAPHCSMIWKKQLELSSKYKIILIDLVGYGKSEKGREANFIHLYGQDVSAVAEELDLVKIILVGYSMGGAVMLEAEKLISERTIGLISVDSLVPGTGYEKLDEEVINQAIQHFKDNFLLAVNNLFKAFMSEKIDPNLIEEMMKDIEKLDKDEMINAYTDMLRWNFKDVLPNISKPIRSIIAGRTLSTKEQRELQEKYFKTVFVEDVGHLLAIEDPIAFNKVLDNLISELIELSP